MPTPCAESIARELVRLPSESSRPVATDRDAPELLVVRRMADLCTAHGVAARTQEAAPGRWNLVARLPRPGAPRLLVAGHADTVSAEGMARPFDGEIAGGQLRGRGACDDKGPLAAALAAVLRLAAEGRRPEFDLTLLATADEEAAMLGARAWAAAGERQDAILVLEPTGLRPVRTHKGLYRATVSAAGLACHSARPECGRNAVHALVPALAGVVGLGEGLARFADPLLGAPTVAITGLAGGTAVNIVPATASATVDCRLTPALPPACMAAMLGERCAGCAVQEIFSAPALAAAELPAGIGQRLAAALAAVRAGGEPEAAPWCSDASYLQALGPCLVLGPGRIELAHTAEESIAVEDLRRGEEFLLRLLTAG